MPVISVVVPTYRRPQLLRRALESVRAQTFEDFEALVCDNGGEEETAAVVCELRDDRFVYVPRPVNLGLVENALQGFVRCTGDLVMKVDDDDALHEDCLERLAAPFTGHPELALSASDFDIVDEEGRLQEAVHDRLAVMTGRDRAPEGYQRPFTALAARGAVHLVSALLRRSAVDWASIDRRCGPAYDLHAALLVARGAAWCHYSRSRLAAYRVHTASDTLTRPVGQLQGSIFALESALASGEHTDVEVLRSQIASIGLRLARELVKEGRPGEARSTLLRTSPPQREQRRMLALSAVPSAVGKAIAVRRSRAAAGRAVTSATSARLVEGP